MRLQVAAAPFLPPWPMIAGGLTEERQKRSWPWGQRVGEQPEYTAAWERRELSLAKTFHLPTQREMQIFTPCLASLEKQAKEAFFSFYLYYCSFGFLCVSHRL